MKNATRPLQLAAAQLATLRHMLGITDPFADRPEPYRNYYCANAEDPHLHALADLGAVELYGQRDGYEWFRCTEAGRAAALASFPTIQKPRGKRRYQRFLSVAEAVPGLTFLQFLTDPQFVEYRA